MNRYAYFIVAALAGTALVACSGPMTEDDAGVDAGARIDSGPQPDAGFDAGRDAGPTGCQTGCAFVELSMGILHSCGRRENGEVLCWGRNQELQFGDARPRHELCSPEGTTPIDCSGTPENTRFQAAGSRPIIEDATEITTRSFSTACAVRGGELWCWSSQTVPDIGGSELRAVAERDGTETDIRQASVGDSHMCTIIGDSGALFCRGASSAGQLGTGEFVATVRDPAPVILDALMPPTELDGVLEVQVSHGGFTCARTATTMYCWGRNGSDQLGDGVDTVHDTCGSGTTSYDCSNLPVEVGSPPDTLGVVSDFDLGGGYVCAIESADGSPGEVFCWGDNRMGQSAQPTGESIGVPSAVGITDAVQVATGGRHACALHGDGTVSCWGNNFHGQLGDGVANHGLLCISGSDEEDCSRTPVSVMNIDDASYIAANGSHTCVIRADGSVWCWGRNNERELGDGTRDNRNIAVMVQETAP